MPTASGIIVGLTDPLGEQLEERQLGTFQPGSLRKRTTQIGGTEGNEWEADIIFSRRWNRRAKVTLPIALSQVNQAEETTTASTTDGATPIELEWRPTPSYRSSQLVGLAWQENIHPRCYILTPTLLPMPSGKTRRPSSAAPKPADLQDIYAVLSTFMIHRYDRDQSIGGKVSIIREGLDERSMDLIALSGMVVWGRLPSWYVALRHVA